MKKGLALGALIEILRTNPDKGLGLRVGKGIFISLDRDTFMMNLEGWDLRDRKIRIDVNVTEHQIILLCFKESKRKIKSAV